jgi:hypothetical protein
MLGQRRPCDAIRLGPLSLPFSFIRHFDLASGHSIL